MKNNVTEIIIEEYKSYVFNVLENTFDFTTWYQHQYGENPTGNVDSTLQFQVLRDEKSHK